MEDICKRYSIDGAKPELHPEYDGCQNLIFYCGTEYVLRISFRDDRTFDQIRAETDFVNYLYKNGVSVCPAIESKAGNLVERFALSQAEISSVLFKRAKGIRFPDNNYQYRKDAPIEEYFQNIGKVLGQMHRLAKGYKPSGADMRRPVFLDSLSDMAERYLPPELHLVRERFKLLAEEVKSLPSDKDGYGLVHADFGDGNYAIDYQNGNITAFDFDDSAYCWFMYDLADTWANGVGHAMFEGNALKRKEIMDNRFDNILEGYLAENDLSDYWLKKLPFFLKLVVMENIINEYRYLALEGDDEGPDEELEYKIACVERDLEYMGFFEGIYSSSHPFSL